MADIKLFQCSCFVFMLVIVLTQGLNTCNVNLDKVGCFKDNINDRHLPDLLITDRDPSDARFGKKFDWTDFKGSVRSLLCRCASRARAMGYKYIGVQYYAECWAGKTKQYAVDGPSKMCMQSYETFGKVTCNYDLSKDCVGLGFTNFVYRLLECREIVEIAVLLDLSTTMQQAEAFDAAKQFLKNLIDLLPLTKKGAHLSLVTFTRTAKVIFDFKSDLNRGGNEYKMKAAIDNIQNVGGSTWPDAALKMADQYIFTEKGGVRPEAPRFIITISDGEIHHDSVITPVMWNLKNTKGVQLLSVGVGSQVKSKEIDALAANKKYNVFDGNQEDAAKKILNRITAYADDECNAPSFS